MSTLNGLDRVRERFDAKCISRDEAIKEIQAIIAVTEVGAADLLEDRRAPSARYGGAA